MGLARIIGVVAAGTLSVGAAHAATVATDGAVFSFALDTGGLTVSAVGEARMDADGAIFLPLAQTDSLVPTEGIFGSYAGAGVSFAANGVSVALTDFFVTDGGEMTGLITARGVDGVGGLVMHGRMTLFDLANAPQGFDLTVGDMAGAVLSDLLGTDLRGQVVAQLSAAPAPTPVPGALILFASGAGALFLRRRA